MERRLDFFRKIITGVIDNRALDYGICKSVDIMLELKTKDEVIKQMLVKHLTSDTAMQKMY